MDSNQLNRVMKSDRMGSIFFRGVFPADRFRDQTVAKLPSGYIINTDPSDEPGSHWVAVYVNGTASNPIGEFFCSYGESPETYNFKNWIESNSMRWTYNEKRYQADSSSVCGHYCLFYLLHRFRNIPLRTIQDMFTNDYVLNDTMVNNFISERFNIDLPVTDFNFIDSQIARALRKKLEYKYLR